MERLYSNIVGTPVVMDDHLRPLTSVKDLLVDPESGKIVALIVNISKNLVIAPMDIVAWHETIMVHDHDSIVDGNEILRVETLQQNNINILHNQVETKSGKKLGRVNDLAIDDKALVLKKLYVSKGFLGLVRYDSRVVDVKNILEVLPDKIVIKDDLATVKVEENKVSATDMAVS